MSTRASSATLRCMSLVAVLACAALAGAGPPAAGAGTIGGLLGGLLSPCPGQILTQPFTPWLDFAH